MNVEVKIEGIKKLQSQLKDYVKKSSKKTMQAMLDTGYEIHKEAVKNITKNGSVDTGRLRNSIAVEGDKKKMEVRIGTNVKYSPYVEFGTGKYAENGKGRKTPWVYYYERIEKFVRTEGMRPKPFLRPAFVSRIGKLSYFLKKEFLK